MPRPNPLASFLLAGGALVAQQSAGPLAGSALAVAIDGGTGSSADAASLVHPNGFGGAPLQFPSAPTVPNLQAILAFYGAPNADVDDISTGRDDVMVDTAGILAPPPSGWGFLSFSFKQGATGLPNSRLAAEPAADRGASVFTWILPGSAVPAALTGVVERSHGRSELGLAAGAEVDALDQPIVLGYDQATLATLEPGFQALLPTVSSIYFTFDCTTFNSVPPSWWIRGNQQTIPSGATIFVTSRSATAGVWTQPHIFKTYADLGLGVAEDIDALAYDESTQFLLFSCVGNARDQLLFEDLSTDAGTPIPVRDAGNQPVNQAVGTAGGDDIDAVCTLDPRVRQGTYAPDDFGASVGTPRDAYLPALYPVGVSASAFRRYSGGQSHFDSWLTGWPPLTGQGPGLAILVLTLGDSISPAITAAFYARNPANPVAGDPTRFTQTIPASYALTGLPLVFRWFAIDGGATELSQAYPLKVFL